MEVRPRLPPGAVDDDERAFGRAGARGRGERLDVDGARPRVEQHSPVSVKRGLEDVDVVGLEEDGSRTMTAWFLGFVPFFRANDEDFAVREAQLQQGHRPDHFLVAFARMLKH
jgi:hypothetical protein